MGWYIIGFAALICVLWIAVRILESKESNEDEAVEAEASDDPKKLYEARGPVLSEAELKFYQVLKETMRHPTDPSCPNQAEVMCKIRMADLVAVKKGLDRSMNQRAFNRIKSKHADFVLVRPGNMGVLCVIELDDSSHNSKKAKARDAFVDSVYATAGIPIVHVACKGAYAKEEVAGMIRGAMGG